VPSQITVLEAATCIEHASPVKKSLIENQKKKTENMENRKNYVKGDR